MSSEKFAFHGFKINNLHLQLQTFGHFLHLKLQKIKRFLQLQLRNIHFSNDFGHCEKLMARLYDEYYRRG